MPIVRTGGDVISPSAKVVVTPFRTRTLGGLARDMFQIVSRGAADQLALEAA